MIIALSNKSEQIPLSYVKDPSREDKSAINK